MLAGRKLLLADDSITIQKVVALTFADEGVEVVTVSDGREAIEKLEEIAADIVLADIFMPVKTGYEVCDYIKQNAKLRHIPVMLLVGSFEPFDEAEARRVGADDILTKPFQSIRRLIDKVGGLVTGKQAEDEVPTAELPQTEPEPDETERLSTAELEITTADTRPLHIHVKDQPADEPAPQHVGAAQTTEPSMTTSESSMDTSDVLLELGDLGKSGKRVSDFSPDEFVLDIDLDEAEPVQAYEAVSSAGTHAFVEPQLSQPTAVGWEFKSPQPKFSPAVSTEESSTAIDHRMADTQEWNRDAVTSYEAPHSEKPATLQRVLDEPPASERATQIDPNQLSPEVIDAIARRAVEHLSERVVQEIAWEVVPDLAELMIKRKLEEKESQPK
ncbi:MAG: response regulator [Pyrinomonadaceae bacterium]